MTIAVPYKTPLLLRKLIPGFIWEVSTYGKDLYLTFDDGPVPRLTEYVLETLERYHAKATFFCVGENVRKYPDLFRRIYQLGHGIGNHTYNHLNGWSTETGAYIENVEKAARVMAELVPDYAVTMFRPPYGRIKPGQSRRLKNRYRIIMWSVLAMDFKADQAVGTGLKEMKKHIDKGSIVVFHDSFKAEKKLRKMLPEILSYYSGCGYQFKKLGFPGSPGELPVTGN